MTFRLRAVDARIIDLPIKRPHRIGAGPLTVQSSVIVRAHTTDGIVGLGEGVTPGGGPGWGGESVETIKALIDGYFTPALCGRELSGPTEVHAVLSALSPAGHFAKAALEMAAWDIVGKQLGCSVAALLGGSCRDRIDVLWSIGADVPDPGHDFRDAVEAGHTAVKFMTGNQSPADAAARIVEALDGRPDRVTVIIDTNGRWDEAAARRWLPVLADAGVDIAEQPIQPWNRAGMARLRSATPLQILADEAVQSTQDALAVADHNSADLIAVKLPKLGGVGPARDVAGIARAAGMGVYGGGTMETSIGTSAAAQLYSTWPTIAGCDLIGPLHLADDIVSTPIRVIDGKLHLPEPGGGLGVELDEEKIDRYVRK